jgi:hypothetical protein
LEFSYYASPTSGQYANWGGSEPNDANPNEDYAGLNIGNSYAGIQPGQWGDGVSTADPADAIVGYLVEWETGSPASGLGNLFAADAIIWHQPLARNGASEDTDPSADGTVKYRFKRGSTIPIQVNALGCTADVTSNPNVVGSVAVFGDSNCGGANDANSVPIDFNGVGGGGGVMEKVGGHLKYNLDTKALPTTTQCYILRVTLTDTSTGEGVFEEVLLQAK